MSILSNQIEQIDVQAFFSEEKEKREKEKVDLKNSETEEFEIFIEILNLFLSECPESMYLTENIYQIVIKLLSYPNNDIKSEISKVFSNSINILFKINVDKNVLDSTSKRYISNIVERLITQNDLIVSYVDTIKDVINATKLFLNID